MYVPESINKYAPLIFVEVVWTLENFLEDARL